MFRDCLVTVILTTVTDITSTVGRGATVSFYLRRLTTPWRSVVKVTRRTVREHVRLEEIFNNNKNGGLKRTCLMIRRKSKTGGIKHTCQVVKLESRGGVSTRPAFADSSDAPEQSVQHSPPMPMQLMNTPCHSGALSESNVPDHLWDWRSDD